jgi:hypothetical protein
MTDQATLDLLRLTIDRSAKVCADAMQLLETDEQRVFLLTGLAASIAHDAAHEMHDAVGGSLAKCWVDTIDNIAHAMCSKIENAMREEMKARKAKQQ